MIVSISCYQDAPLLPACIDSVREHLPGATIHLVSGRYATWPDGPDNCDDGTADLAVTRGIRWFPDGPYADESAKWRHRASLVPDDERVLFLDADERLVRADTRRLNQTTAYRPRIFNALVYGPRVTYWPRLCRPQDIQAIERWDAFEFDADALVDGHPPKTDAVTIAHRHDLRSDDYKRDKQARFANEGRQSAYAKHDRMDDYFENVPQFRAEWTDCPECGQESVVKSVETNSSGQFTRVHVCVNGDCYGDVVPVDLERRYLPDDWQRGIREGDVRQVRMELIDAGCAWAQTPSLDLFLEMATAIPGWIGQNLDGAAEVK